MILAFNSCAISPAHNCISSEILYNLLPAYWLPTHSKGGLPTSTHDKGWIPKSPHDKGEGLPKYADIDTLHLYIVTYGQDLEWGQ